MTMTDIDDIDKMEGVYKDAEPPKPKRKQRTSSGVPVKLKGQLEAMFSLIGGLVASADKFDGEIITKNASELAEHLYQLAAQNPRVRHILEMLLEGGAWSGVVGVVGVRIVLPITVHHDMWPPDTNASLAGFLGIEDIRKRHLDEDEGTDTEFHPQTVPESAVIDQ